MVDERNPKKGPAGADKPQAGSQPYLAGDPIPVPEAQESDSDTVWGLWEASHSPSMDPVPKDPGNTAFEPTVPADLTPATPTPPKSHR